MIVGEIYGNLFEGFEDKKYTAIAHGCNCFHSMGAGIAGYISKVYPESLEADKQTKFASVDKLGTFSIAETEFGQILNMYTQYHPGRDLRIESLVDCFKLLNEQYKGKVVAIPKIGCGIAGGNWDEVKQLINSVTPDVEIDVYYV